MTTAVDMPMPGASYLISTAPRTLTVSPVDEGADRVGQHRIRIDCGDLVLFVGHLDAKLLAGDLLAASIRQSIAIAGQV